MGEDQIIRVDRAESVFIFNCFAHFFASPLLFSDDTERALVAVSFFVVTLESDERAALTQVFCGGGAREPQIAAIRI